VRGAGEEGAWTIECLTLAGLHRLTYVWRLRDPVPQRPSVHNSCRLPEDRMQQQALTVVPEENRMVLGAAASTTCGSGRVCLPAAPADRKTDHRLSPGRSCGG
jgi:hypothetical protein